MDELVRRAGATPPGEAAYSHVMTELGGRPVRLVRESPAGLPGITILGERADAGAVAAAMTAAAGSRSIEVLAPSAYEALRIEAGTPVFGKDVTEKNLPQEFGRDDQAISFVKGCYLGQETVARIDALGHVNQFLKGLALRAGHALPATGHLAGSGRQARRRDHLVGRLALARASRGAGDDPCDTRQRRDDPERRRRRVRSSGRGDRGRPAFPAAGLIVGVGGLWLSRPAGQGPAPDATREERLEACPIRDMSASTAISTSRRARIPGSG